MIAWLQILDNRILHGMDGLTVSLKRSSEPL
jgi:hypothetical protein